MGTKNLSFKAKLTVLVTKQGKRFVAYTPALDVATSGKSEKDARKKFEELINLFLEEIVEEGTVNEVLSELGWKKVQRKWTPPRVVSRESMDFRIPAMV